MTEAYITEIQNLVTAVIDGFDSVQSAGNLTPSTRQQMTTAVADLRAKLNAFVARLRQCTINRLITGADGQKLIAEMRRESAEILGRGYTTVEVQAMAAPNREQLAQRFRAILARDSALLAQYEQLRDATSQVASKTRQAANAGVVWSDRLSAPSNLSSGDIWTGPSGQRYLVDDQYQVCLGSYCENLDSWQSSPYRGYGLTLGTDSYYIPYDYYLDPVINTQPWLANYLYG